MNTPKSALKNMEAIFTVAVAIACGASYVSFMQPSAAKTAEAAEAAQANAIPVVVVSAKRLTEQEKKISLIEERQALLGNATASTL
ncbi:hypothetical protein [Janthinobacterium sp. JC611]|uniref:hypothetical protein n=1 Tax=Janthinobacterium sp. JC611 TaxID=2816201 RepID=UPI001BFE118C|nr:hypothetical protein [Janthinobacterium sp. JC611]